MERCAALKFPPHLSPLPPKGGEGRVRGNSRADEVPLLLRNSIRRKKGDKIQLSPFVPAASQLFSASF